MLLWKPENILSAWKKVQPEELCWKNFEPVTSQVQMRSISAWTNLLGIMPVKCILLQLRIYKNKTCNSQVGTHME